VGKGYCVEHYAYLKFIWLRHGDQDTDRTGTRSSTVVPWNSDDLSGRVFATTLMRMITDATVDK
jgi:hypothetical protein